jgi:hypothetical protein
MVVCSYGEKRDFEEATLKVTPGGDMGNKIYDDLDKLPAAPRVDISETDLLLLERAARAIGASALLRVVAPYWSDAVGANRPGNLKASSVATGACTV